MENIKNLVNSPFFLPTLLTFDSAALLTHDVHTYTNAQASSNIPLIERCPMQNVMIIMQIRNIAANEIPKISPRFKFFSTKWIQMTLCCKHQSCTMVVVYTCNRDRTCFFGKILIEHTTKDIKYQPQLHMKP